MRDNIKDISIVLILGVIIIISGCIFSFKVIFYKNKAIVTNSNTSIDSTYVENTDFEHSSIKDTSNNVVNSNNSSNSNKTDKKRNSDAQNYIDSRISGTCSNNYYSNNSTNKVNSNSKSTSSSNTSNTQIQTGNTKTYSLNLRSVGTGFGENGQEVEKYILTVISYQTEAENLKIAKIKDNEEWIIVNMKLENKSSSTVVIDRNDFKIIDGAGKYNYGSSSHHLDTELDLIELKAGQTATFSVRFLYYKNNEMVLRFSSPFRETSAFKEIKLR